MKYMFCFVFCRKACACNCCMLPTLWGCVVCKSFGALFLVMPFNWLWLSEMVDQGRNMCDVTSIPIIGDGDTGYGNALNVKRTVRAYTAAGFAGIILEDQVMPKRCGHTRGKKVVDREEAVMRIKAAADARAESGRDIVIVARTDSRQTTGLEEALWRVKAFKEAGADVLFIDALESRAEMEALCKAAGGTPTMANMLEGGGKTPIFSPMELQDIGYKLIAYPLSLMMVSVSAMESALTALKSGRMPPSLPTFAHVRKVIGFDDYYVDEARYATSPPVDPEGPRVAPSGTAAATPVEPKTVMPAQPQTKPNAAKEEVVESQLKAAGVEADFILSPRDDEGQPQGRYRSSNASDRDTSGSSRSWSSSNSTSRSSNVVVDTELVGPVGPGPESGGGGRKREKTREEMRDGMSNRSLRLRVTSSTGVHKLDLTVPAGFLGGLAGIVPAVAGLNLKVLVDDALEDRGTRTSTAGGVEPIIDIVDPSTGDRVQIYIE
eukprot:jgi/Mesvir1/14989/Mv14649-RA.2